jgi:hypothetical protein
MEWTQDSHATWHKITGVGNHQGRPYSTLACGKTSPNVKGKAEPRADQPKCATCQAAP